MNEYDSSRISDLMGSDHDYEMASCEEEADVLLLNTCSIREKAQEKVFHQLGRWRLLKNDNPDLVIGVGGCVASQEGQNIKKRAQYVDLVFGPQTIHRLPAMVAEAKSNQLPVIDVTFPELEKFDCLPEPGVAGPSAFVSIMEGCSKYCSFCVVPYTRGEEISRSVESVMKEVVSLSKKGVKEIHLLGQNVNSYQGDLNGDKVRLSELLYYIAELPEIGRIRYTTSHPMEFTDDLIQAYADLPKLVDHLHLPVQAGSNAVLKAMKRGHTVESYKEKIGRLRQVRPNISLSSDFIVGFPGETRADFEKTLELIDEIGFDLSFSFVYSARPGTPAASLKDEISLQTKKSWLAELQGLINKQTLEISQSMMNETHTVLVTGASKKDENVLSGRTENNRVVNFDGDLSQTGEFVDVRVTEVLPNSLRGLQISET